MEYKYYVGIDIGSTAAKTAVISSGKLLDVFSLPTGWSGKDTARCIGELLRDKGYGENMRCIATGYGRSCVDFADKAITEITCHARGASALFGENCLVIDVGGQDTKVITVEAGAVKDFIMNDKCAAGTGKFIEVMANRLGVSLEELYSFAELGQPTSISSMCTVFAESEVISQIGEGEKRENIAAGIIRSIASKVANLAARQQTDKNTVLTGGLSRSEYFAKVLSNELKQDVRRHPLGIYAGALGAALISAGRTDIIAQKE